MKYYTTVQESEDGEAYIVLDPLLLTALRWDSTTKLLWSIDDNGTVFLSKKVDNNVCD